MSEPVAHTPQRTLQKASQKTRPRQNVRRNVRRSEGSAADAPRAARPAAPSGSGWSHRPRLLAATVLAATALLMTGGLWGYGKLRESGFLTLRNIEINGNARATEGQLLSRLHLPKNALLPGLDLDAISRQFLTHPWVERVAVRRSYPSTLSIRIWERTPRVLLTDPSGVPLWLVDGEGAVLTRSGPATVSLDHLLATASGSPSNGPSDNPSGNPSDSPSDSASNVPPRLLAVSGIPARGLAPGSRVDAERVRLALELAAAWGRPDLSVDVTDPHDPLLLSEGLRVRLGDAGGYDWRLARLEQLRPRLMALGGSHGAEVDLRYDDRVVARPL